MSMEKSPILHPSNSRLINLTTYVAVVVMGVLGASGLTGLMPRLVAATLCIAFALVYAFAVRSKNFAPRANWYFATQTVLLLGLVALRTERDGTFIFLAYLLTIQAATVFPGRTAAAWALLLFAVISLDYLDRGGVAGLVPVLFNSVVFLVSLMVGHNIRQTELARRTNQRLVEQLQAAQDQLQELAVAEERNRLAREIHDGLGHYLTATTMQIQGARALLENTDAATQGPAALTALGKAETLLQEALADVRRSVTALRTAPTEKKPLPTAIGDLVTECRASAGLEVQFDLLGKPRPLNSQVELTLYRVAQEGLTNVRKHAQATRVEVALCYDNDKVGLSICDDGQGMSETSNGFGLLGLRERVQLVGGTIDISTAPNQGCQLGVEIPT
jgi:signal transduction histidine kinase